MMTAIRSSRRCRARSRRAVPASVMASSDARPSSGSARRSTSFNPTRWAACRLTVDGSECTAPARTVTRDGPRHTSVWSNMNDGRSRSSPRMTAARSMSRINRARPVPIRLATSRSSATGGEPRITPPLLYAAHKYLVIIKDSATPWTRQGSSPGGATSRRTRVPRMSHSGTYRVTTGTGRRR
jgi:hypothetical protein